MGRVLVFGDASEWCGDGLLCPTSSYVSATIAWSSLIRCALAAHGKGCTFARTPSGIIPLFPLCAQTNVNKYALSDSGR